MNNLLLGGGDVELSKGVYDVEIYTNFWGQPYLEYASVVVRKKDSEQAIPLVNTAADIKEFLGQTIAGRKVVEASKYRPRSVDLSGRLRQGAVLKTSEDRILP